MIETLLEQLQSFAASEKMINAVLLVGSHAKGTAGPDSDVDLVLITSDPDRYLRNRRWLERFGIVLNWELEDYQLVQSLRVFYENGPEVEFGITSLDWIAESQLQSTGKILSGGYRVIHDPANLIDGFCRRAK